MRRTTHILMVLLFLSLAGCAARQTIEVTPVDVEGSWIGERTETERRDNFIFIRNYENGELRILVLYLLEESDDELLRNVHTYLLRRLGSGRVIAIGANRHGEIVVVDFFGDDAVFRFLGGDDELFVDVFSSISCDEEHIEENREACGWAQHRFDRLSRELEIERRVLEESRRLPGEFRVRRTERGDVIVEYYIEINGMDVMLFSYEHYRSPRIVYLGRYPFPVQIDGVWARLTAFPRLPFGDVARYHLDEYHDIVGIIDTRVRRFGVLHTTLETISEVDCREERNRRLCDERRAVVRRLLQIYEFESRALESIHREEEREEWGE